jgi:hypothetical protein
VGVEEEGEGEGCVALGVEVGGLRGGTGSMGGSGGVE